MPESVSLPCGVQRTCAERTSAPFGLPEGKHEVSKVL